MLSEYSITLQHCILPHKYAVEVYIWITLYTIPLNSTVNPMVYILRIKNLRNYLRRVVRCQSPPFTPRGFQQANPNLVKQPDIDVRAADDRGFVRRWCSTSRVYQTSLIEMQSFQTTCVNHVESNSELRHGGPSLSTRQK